ncbi:hypothetical protein C8Q80DRAFT_1220875 [Daedaleopsis nitida]|nr:hypothetical protein C8Q80DRAFT_1220875 [Daedaleopsis nitida]
MTSYTLWSLLFLSLCSSLVGAQQSFTPASYPLSVRAPYLSVWYKAPAGSAAISDSWPVFWGQTSIMGWAGKIRVDGKTYAWMGNDRVDDGAANVTNTQVTPTRTIFSMQAGPMNIVVTYLSPIEPADWVKQSLPFSYVSIEASSADGSAHDVQVYADISAEWLSGDRTSNVKWTTQSTGSSIIHEIELQTPQANKEINHQASDGKMYHAMASVSGQTWQIDTDTTCRNAFKSSGQLSNIASSNFGPISNPFPVFAIAVDLGQIQSTSDPVTWSVGYVRDPVVQYTTASGETQDRRPFFVTQYSTINSAIDAFTNDFKATNDSAVALDNKIMADAAKISSKLVDLVSLGARQTFAAMDITVLGGSKGSINASDVKIFMKDNGATTTRVSPVERMFAAFPALIYANASFGGSLLAPLLESQDSLTGQQYAIQDLGTTYPIASGPHGAHQQGVEQSGNMLIMMYAHARFSGDGSLLSRHYNLAKRWADYLVDNTLTPENQQSADLETRANMTNLAIKGIIAVKAMAEISRAVGQDFDAQQYDNHASALIGSWLSLSQSNFHFLGAYGAQGSWSLMYNLYADILLGTNLVSQDLLANQANFYGSLTPPAFGLPIDSTSGVDSSSAWSLMTAATVSDTSVRDNLIGGVWARAASNLTAGAFADVYNNSGGSQTIGNAGPAVGAMFAHLALTVANQTINTSFSGPGGENVGSDTSSGTPIGPIVGGVVGGMVIIAIAVVAFIFWRRHKRRHESDEKIEIVGDFHRPSLQPYNYELAHQNPTSSSLRGQSPYTGTAGSHRGPGSDYRGAGGGSQYINPGVAGMGAAAMGAYDPQPSPPLSSPTDPYATNAYETPVVPISSKARERALNQTHHYAPSSVTSSSVTGAGSAVSASSQDPLSPRTHSGTASSSLSPTEVLSLRAEVENLRRVMQEIRAERLEPPPEYGA